MIYSEDPTPFEGITDLTPAHGMERVPMWRIRLATITAHLEAWTLRLPWVADIIGAQTRRNVELRSANWRLLEQNEALAEALADRDAWLKVLSLSIAPETGEGL